MNISSGFNPSAIQSSTISTQAKPAIEDNENLFSLVDSNSSGGISLKEVNSFGTSAEGDEDSIGLPGMESVSGDMVEKMFNFIDADGDGELTTSELEQAGEAMQKAMAGGMQASSGGGDDSEEEFDELDTNKDGIVSAQELADALMKMQDTVALMDSVNSGSNSEAVNSANPQFTNQIQQYLNQASSSISSSLTSSSGVVSQLA